MRSFVRAWARRTCLALVFLGCAATGNAASLNVSPIRVVLGKEQATTTVAVRNDGDGPVVVQTRVVAWSQDKGRDVYTPTPDVLASPPIFTVAPQATQVIRLGLRREPDDVRELAYRIFLEEVPGPEKPATQGVQMLLRIGLPIFVTPRAPQPADFSWRADRGTGSTLTVTLDNAKGTRHVQVTGIKLGPVGADAVWAEESAAAYVLPGQVRTWTLKPRVPEAAKGERVRLRATTDAGNADTELTLSGR